MLSEQPTEGVDIRSTPGAASVLGIERHIGLVWMRLRRFQLGVTCDL